MKRQELIELIRKEVAIEIRQEIMDEIEFQNKLEFIDLAMVGIMKQSVSTFICFCMPAYLDINYFQCLQIFYSLAIFNVCGSISTPVETVKSLVSNAKWQMVLAVAMLIIQKILGY